MSWSREAWAAAEPVYDRIVKHPFVEQLGRGTLSDERFRHYLRQDALYLGEYGRVLTHIASRLRRADDIEAFIRFASDGIAVERALHEVFLQGDRPSPDEMTPTTLLYTSLLRSQALASVEEEAAAVLPCFWIYKEVGDRIVERSAVDGNPYRAWIETYADEAFACSTRRAIAICDRLADETDAETRRRMTDIFVRCARMEYLFWDSAWELEKWKI